MTQFDIMEEFRRELYELISDDELRELAIESAVDYANLKARKELGEPVDDELALAEATMKDIGVIGSITAATVLNNAIEKTVAFATKFLITVTA